MNLTLHWLRRDFRRHVPALALWALLVALFTWARIWLRTHPDFFIGDRDLWLSVPAAGLGFAEVCLLLRILMDDPARGSHAFWKTRPPSGAAVFAAKTILCALAALVIPFAAEGVFLAAVGPSAGTPERTSLYLLPPVLALMAGAVVGSWKSTLLWLPVVIGIFAAGVGVIVWLGISGRLEYVADHRLIVVTVLLSAVAAAALLYRCSAGKPRFIAALTAPVLAGLCAAATGWPRDARLHTPPPGMAPAEVHAQWLRSPALEASRFLPHPWMSLPLQLHGLPGSRFYEASLRDIVIEAEGITITRVRVWSPERHLGAYGEAGKGPTFSIKLSEEEGASLTGKSRTISGTLVLRAFNRAHHSLALDRTHTLEAGDCRWVITPATLSAQRRVGSYSGNPNGHFWIDYEFMSPAPLSLLDDGWIDSQSAFLRRAAGDVSVRLGNINFRRDFLLWEGVGRGGCQSGFGPAHEAHELHDPATWKNWTLEFDTLTLSGTLEVPFTLHWPE